MKKIKKINSIFTKSTFVLDSKISVKKIKIFGFFGAWFGEKYADNSKYLFEYVNKNHPEIRVIWVTRNENIINKG